MAKTCSKNNPSMMNKRVDVQQLVRTSDSQGGYTEAWATIATVWAKLEPVKAYEKFQAAQTETPVSHNVTMRYRPSITDQNRLLYNGRIFGIKEVINVGEADAFLSIKAIERAA